MLRRERTKELIIHADDLGMSHSVNCAVFEAFAKGAISSASAIITAPWAQEVGTYAENCSALDIGVHLTVTSEWQNYRWRPAVSQGNSQLADVGGWFYREAPSSLHGVGNQPSLEVELLAQVRLAECAGISPTHVDSHMYELFRSKNCFETYVRVAQQCRLPFLIHPHLVNPDWRRSLSEAAVALDGVLEINGGVMPARWLEWYLETIRTLRPGLWQLTVHPGYDDDELRIITDRRYLWGSAWRQRDLNVLLSSQFKECLAENNVRLIDWKELASRH